MENSEINFEKSELNCLESFLDKIRLVLLDFNEFKLFNKNKFMLLTCGHAFHTSCLEKWLKEKRECPTDRSDIGNIDF